MQGADQNASEQLRSLAIGDTGFVFDPRTGHSFTVNGTGLYVLRGLQAGRSPADIATDLEQNLEQAFTASGDVQEFVTQLRELGVLRTADGGSR